MNIRQVKKKVKSVSNVKKITRSMQLVSAIKMKKAQLIAVEGRPYQDNLEKIIRRVMGRIDTTHSKLIDASKTVRNQDLVILISTNKGLCGSFNFDLFRHLLKNLDIKKTDFIIVGKKASQILARVGGNILADFSSPLPLNNVSAVFNLAVTNFLAGHYQSVSLIFNRFISTLKHQPVQEVLLPLKLKLDELSGDKNFNEYLVEPSPEAILDRLLRSYVEERIRNAIIQSEAGEHSSRMIAMKNATDNANDVIYNLTLLGNKLRQEKITNELLDMITAKESVEVV